MKWQRKNARPIQIDGDVAFVTLTMGKITVIDAADAKLFEGWNWHTHKCKDGSFYARRNSKVDGKRVRIKAHHVVVGGVSHGFVPHHLDGDGLNNRRKNLEVITTEANNALARAKGRTTLRRQAGKKKWKPRKLMSIENRTGSVRYVKIDKAWSAQIPLGQYRTREEAEEVRAWAVAAMAAHLKENGPPVHPAPA